MKKLFKIVWILSLSLIFVACNKEDLKIEGLSQINLDEIQSYNVIFDSEDNVTMSSYVWSVTPKDANYTLSATHTQDVLFIAHTQGEYTLNVSVEIKGKKLNTELIITAIKPEVVNGYTLPPEPDKTLNNATLLGVDSNDNGIRDDVEIFIIKRYAQDPDYSKTKTALSLQYAYSMQKILENPIAESKKYSDDAIDCESYWFDKVQKDIYQKIIDLDKKDFKESILLSVEATKWRTKHEVFNDTTTKDKIFNTRERINQKFSYNASLSGSIFNGRGEATIDSCQINIDGLGE